MTINIDNQDKIHTNTAKGKAQKSNLLNTVTTEHIAQKTQSTNRTEQNKEQRVDNIITTRMGKARTRKSDHRPVRLWMWIKRT